MRVEGKLVFLLKIITYFPLAFKALEGYPSAINAIRPLLDTSSPAAEGAVEVLADAAMEQGASDLLL